MAIAFFKFASALFTRVIFFVHGFVSVYLVWLSKNKDSTYWWLSTGLVLLFFETIYTILMRKGKEYKYFWPSSLLYMATVLPSIWVAEMSILHAKQTDPNCESNSASTVYALGGGIVFKTDRDTLTQKWSKLGLILVIIVARWLLPRGELTRDQLSTLLLVYVANAADIMELFELFDDEPLLWCKKGVAESVLVTYTWCFMQFTLVFTATAKSEPDEVTKQAKPDEWKTPGIDKTMPKYIRKMIMRKRKEKVQRINRIFNTSREIPGENTDKEKPIELISYTRRKRKRYSIQDTVQNVVAVQREVRREEEIIEEVIKEKEKLRLHGDLYSILTIMLMQDGPFLVLRLVMLVQFRVDSEMHLFFTGKNAMALAVLFYRLLVLLYDSKEDDDEDEGGEGGDRDSVATVSDTKSVNSNTKLATSVV
ncbi:transmembrane protein 26 [Nematostella vectensis]|uniref:transmembrane protein 26 n=1 Tax=Nematostella vectensis TaxID=45351 RepID=UPI00207766B9|nr:transmembrane protein 26 [Nematostella vectensis]